MTGNDLTYAVVTPAHNEETNLGRIAESMVAQSRQPTEWLIVDDGSEDSTRQKALDLADSCAWIRLIVVRAPQGAARGGPVVRSFNAGVKALSKLPDVIVKLDADVSFPDTYFERLLERFARDDRLGIASGSAHEERHGAWRQRFSTGTSVWGASRAYRGACLLDVSPLSERMGWDAIDEHKAHALGWWTATFLDIPFFHHRGEGERDSSATSAWRAQGSVSHYLGYRPTYIVLRAGFRALRTPAALHILVGYADAVLRRDPRCDDDAVVRRIREQQRLRNVLDRFREARGGSLGPAPR